MRIWCAHCKRAQEIHIPRHRRRRLLETLAGHVGMCAVCSHPVSAIGTAMGGARRTLHEPYLGASSATSG